MRQSDDYRHRENMDTLNSNIPVSEPLLLSVIFSWKGETHQIVDTICINGKNKVLLKGHDL
jgi:hypothetical protein